MKRFCTTLVIICYLIVLLPAQEEEKEDLTQKPAQITFFYPLGTNTINSHKHFYNLSLNILVGRTGATDGFEAAGWVNINDKFIRGFQGAGIGNACFGNGEAFQGAGIFNFVLKDFKGFQGAGIVNTTGGKVEGAQISGIGNFSQGLKGAQFAGIYNVSWDTVTGAQFAGIVNLATGTSENFQGAGIVNVSDKNQGAQMAGVGNLAVRNKGAQIAGIFNAADNIEGAQIAGIVNVADNVEGVQLAGILNICDSIDGVPIALVSYVHKNGYRKIEASTSEMNLVSGTFKTGVREFYTLFTVGYNPSNEHYNTSFGAGIGTSILLKKQKSAIDIELRTSQYSKDFRIYNTLLNNSLVIDYSVIILNRVEMFAGPTFNILYANEPLEATYIVPSWARAYKNNNKLWGWIGFHAGLRL